MKKTSLIPVITALLLAIIALSCALAEGTLSTLIGIGETLLFDTDNVTITGSAEFKLDGKRFKTAEIAYVQDGCNSFWQEKLKTPRLLRSDSETGFTVIANEGSVFVMEPYTPGVYRTGYAYEHDTLLRDTLESRLLLSFIRNTASIAEPALHITREDGEIRIIAAEGETPAIMNDVLLMAARFVGKRLFGYEYDKMTSAEYYLGYWTETREIFYMTESCRLRSGAVSFSLDDTGRLTGAKGTASIELNYTDYDTDLTDDDEVIDMQYVRGRHHLLEISFDITVGEYGTSSVKAFDPEEYQVVRQERRTSSYKPAKEAALPADLDARVREAWLAAGLEGAEQFETVSCYEEDGVYSLLKEDPRSDTENGYWIYITDEGNVLSMSDHQQPEYEYWCKHKVPVTVELSEEMRKRIDEFIQSVTPGLEYSELVIDDQAQDGDVVYVQLVDTNDDLQSEIIMHLVIRVSPTWQVMHYTCVGNG